MKKILSFIITSLIIGNIVSWMMGSWPITFIQQAYSEQELATLQVLQQELEDNPKDAEVLVELGAMYSMHNDIDLANNYLTQAITLDPEHPLIIAWFNANSAKLSGASLDFSMGFYKLYTLSHALKQISKAVDLAPNDLTIRLIRLATFANIGKINSDFNLVFNDEIWFENLLKQSSFNLPEQVKGQFYLAMAQAYFFKADEVSSKKVDKYLSLYQGVKAKTPQEQAQYKILETQFAKVDRGNQWK
ncbi:tetratricopeptide repeat protein [Pseudoalteromonas denitrificans]|uniref:Tetratricopeptide repeat-containing protein n=1 Tax=Pseudoalteromonas denitrificans DSM 6059 TaxID=1123010 RepID=A0A1I1I7F8_9GAMM|nr:hypothetical protein [Pseudoalteromonas denitrificans]SFC32217.1 hypothetical protein SAMN02745724_01418 [Pseudoalteromonas denitrificans DSM 6059]